jgi:homocysteine S-methyltransferase
MYDAHRVLPQLSGEIFVTDGGFETHMIFNEGQDLPNFSAFLLTDSDAGRDRMREYYRRYIPIAKKAGKGFVFDSNTWRASADWGALVGYDAAKLRQNNIDSIAFCREMAKEFTAAGVTSLISGVIGPRRDGWKYDAGMTVAEAEQYHGAQVLALADAGVDYITAYTLTNTPEAIGIANAAREAGRYVVLSFTLETDGNLPGGKPLGEAIEETDAATRGYPAYYMLNCVHPVHFASTVRHGGRWLDRIGGLRANASMKSHAELDESETLDVGDWQDLAQRYGRIMPLLPNLRVIGGCCGTDHRHIGAICAHVMPAAAA